MQPRTLTHEFLSRDYQHLHRMTGCAPSFSLNPQQRGLLGFVDMKTAKRVDIDDVDSVKTTVAQTIDRSQFAAVGLGRPSFNTSTSSPYRSTGFMSEQRLFYTDANNAEQSVFKSCKTIDQCFMDMFTHNGKQHKRMVYHPVKKQMQNWTGADGEVCGVFGIWMNDPQSVAAMCPEVCASCLSFLP